MHPETNHPQLTPSTEPGGEDLHYEPNPKHKNPWQVGKNGTPCPPMKDLSIKMAMAMLQGSELVGDKRYAVHNGRAYAAQQHLPGRWHGYPVGWMEVNSSLRMKWRDEDKVTKKDMQRHWVTAG